MCEELCLRCKMRICWETHELKVVCNVSLLHHSTGTDLAKLCSLAHSPGQPVLVLHVPPSLRCLRCVLCLTQQQFAEWKKSI